MCLTLQGWFHCKEYIFSMYLENQISRDKICDKWSGNQSWSSIEHLKPSVHTIKMDFTLNEKLFYVQLLTLSKKNIFCENI